MAHKLDSRYIGGLQIWYYSNGAWTFRDDDQCGPLWDHLIRIACDEIKNLLLNSELYKAVQRRSKKVSPAAYASC